MLKFPFIDRKNITAHPFRFGGIFVLSVVVIAGSLFYVDSYFSSHSSARAASQTASSQSAPVQPVSIGSPPDNSEIEDNPASPSSPPDPSSGQTPPAEGGSSPAASPTNSDYKTSFKDGLFFGDSITEGLSFYEYLNEANVISSMGITLYKAPAELDKVTLSHPKNIFLLFGINDIDGVMTDEKFISEYTTFIHAIRSKFPAAKIYVQSILPVTADATKKKPALTNARIEDLNADLSKLAKQEKISYLDIAAVTKNAPASLYEPDGIHFKSSFYPMWLNYILTHI